MSNEVIAALIGVVLGAAAAGLINWLIARSNFKREKQAELNIRRKSRLYTPLRRALLRFQAKLNEEPFPTAFKVEPDDPIHRIRHHEGGPDFSIWQEMKYDARLYHLPKTFQERLDGFIDLLRQYNESNRQFAIFCGKAWGPIVTAITDRIHEDRGNSPNYIIASRVLANSPEDVADWFKRSDQSIKEDVWEKAGMEMIDKVSDDPDCLKLRELMKQIQHETEFLIIKFSGEIENIVTMYEERIFKWKERAHARYLRFKKRRDKGNPDR